MQINHSKCSMSIQIWFIYNTKNMMLLRVLFDAHSDNGRTTEYKSKRKHKTRAIDLCARIHRRNICAATQRKKEKVCK